MAGIRRISSRIAEVIPRVNKLNRQALAHSVGHSRGVLLILYWELFTFLRIVVTGVFEYGK